MRIFWQVAIAPLLALTQTAVAQQIEAGERGVEQFRVVPGNCIVKSEDLCQARFEFYWRLYLAEEACIYLNGAMRAVYCSPILKNGEVALDLAVGETTRFTLALKRAPEHSVSKDVKVLTIGRDLRVRRRHLWSFL